MASKIAVPSKKIKKNQVAIKKANKAFERLSPAQKRVAIARDAILQIKSKKFKVESGNTYIEFNAIRDREAQKIEGSQQLCDVLKKFKGKHICTVCARGALFLSAVRKFNHLTVDQASVDNYGNFCIESPSCIKYEDKFFSPEQQILIEDCFEMGYTRPGAAAARFGKSFKDDDDRLIAICENIIANKGTFVIPDEYNVDNV